MPGFPVSPPGGPSSRRPRAVRAGVPAALASLEIPPRGPDGGDGPRRRDRRGRGIRGPLLPPSAPANRTRAERFDEHVLAAVEKLERTWGRALRGTEFAVEDVPPSDPAPWEDAGVPLGRFFPAEAGQPARIVVYRRPVEQRALDAEDTSDLVRDVVVEQVGHMLGRSPEEIDPGYLGGH
ncbi:metallopeptidase family protein [Oerskovia flava]|uniref:metallopeptidase family protein n=1 Tax=Oerskovia flava TaxID=2986422 RepID=UPI002AD44697|nr:metallopeptidase family protein [Oerskovia sp. JB1-3-2]